MNKYIRKWSILHKAHFVAYRNGELIWECKSKEKAKKLYESMNAGVPYCKGSNTLGTACGTCIKCECIK